MSVTVTFEGDSHADIVHQVRIWLETVEAAGDQRLTPSEAVEQGGQLYKDALKVIASAAPRPVAENEIVKSLTEMGYRATDATTARLVDGLERMEEVSGGTVVRDVAETGRSAVWEMNSALAKQLLKQLSGS